MDIYIERNLSKTLTKYTKLFPVILLTGPRQSGKSTFLQNELKEYEYITFDDYKISNFFREDPEGFFEKYKSKIIIDEIQKEPEIFNYLKKVIDENRYEYGKYILSGSNQFTMLKNVTESLAGRIGLLELLPFQRNEIPKYLRDLSVFKGSYPELILRKYYGNEEWYSSYINTYLNKDVKQLTNIGDLRYFKSFIDLLTANTSQILNMSTYSKELGVSVPTIKRWISVLEASYIIFLLQPYHENIKKRIVKSPKIYFYDTGLVSYITGVQTEKLFEFGPLSGAIFENYIITETIKFLLNNNIHAKIYFLRTSNQLEIDLIVKYQTKTFLIEIKKTNTSNINMFNPIKTFIKDNPDMKQKAFLIYKGTNFEYGKDIEAINYDYFLTKKFKEILKD